MLIELHDYYRTQGIHPLDFRCPHYGDCSAGGNAFTTSKMTYVGSEYEKGTLPRLLFLSLDSGSADADPHERTLEAVRRQEEHAYDEAVVAQLPKARHWYRTHQMAWTILRRFEPSLTLASAKPYWAHANSAKCCQNNPGRSEAHARLFRNCKPYVQGELELLRPEILVTQGAKARDVVASLPRIDFTVPTAYGEVWAACIGNRPVLCITTLHPTARPFGKKEMARWEPYADMAQRFIAQMAPEQRQVGVVHAVTNHLQNGHAEGGPLQALLASQALPVAQAVETLPTAPGVYRLFRASTAGVETLYVGSAVDLRERVSRQALRSQGLVDGYSVQYVLVHEDQERMQFEQYAVAQLKPRLNA